MINRTLLGGCQCGEVTVEVTLTSEPDSFSPRACDCDFCRENAAIYISDPNGAVVIRAAAISNLKFAKQGDEVAEFIFCSGCKQLIGVHWHQYGSVNVRFLFDRASFGSEISVSPKQLSCQEKVERWQKIWFREFLVAYSNTSAGD